MKVISLVVLDFRPRMAGGRAILRVHNRGVGSQVVALFNLLLSGMVTKAELT